MITRSLLAALLLTLPAVPRAAAPPLPLLPGEGKSCPMPGGYRFTYRFAERPAMGTVVLRVQVYDKSGKAVRDFKVQGRYDMPEMAGAHDSGEIAFKLSKKGVYLLPVDVAMPGEWEVTLTFYKDGKRFHAGRFRFEV